MQRVVDPPAHISVGSEILRHTAGYSRLAADARLQGACTQWPWGQEQIYANDRLPPRGVVLLQPLNITPVLRNFAGLPGIPLISMQFTGIAAPSIHAGFRAPLTRNFRKINNLLTGPFPASADVPISTRAWRRGRDGKVGQYRFRAGERSLAYTTRSEVRSVRSTARRQPEDPDRGAVRRGSQNGRCAPVGMTGRAPFRSEAHDNGECDSPRHQPDAGETGRIRCLLAAGRAGITANCPRRRSLPPRRA